MPSKRPRVALTIPEDLLGVLADVSEASGKPIATFIVEMLQEMRPQLDSMAKLFRFAREGKKSAALRLAETMTGQAVLRLHEASQRVLPLKGSKKPGKGSR